jgi:hypothetical protein
VKEGVFTLEFAKGHWRRWFGQPHYHVGEICPHFWGFFDGGFNIQVGMVWCGWYDYMSRFEDKDDNVAHGKACPICH